MAYRRNYGYGKKLSDYKWGIAIITFLAIIVVALSVVTKGFVNWDTSTWFVKDTACEHVLDNDSKCTICGELVELEVEDTEKEAVEEDDVDDSTLAIQEDNADFNEEE